MNSATTLAELKAAQYLSAQTEEVHEAFLSSRLKEVHTALPGIVQDFNVTAKTVSVQPAIQRVFDDGPKNLPLCVDVPIILLGGGGFCWSFPIAKGDECLLLFSERAIDAWWQSGGIQLPSEYRFHDLSDGFALVGPLSLPNAAFAAGSGAELWNRSTGTWTKIFSIDAAGNVNCKSLTATGEVTARGKNLSAHKHAITVSDFSAFGAVANLSTGNVAAAAPSTTEAPT